MELDDFTQPSVLNGLAIGDRPFIIEPNDNHMLIIKLVKKPAKAP